MQISSTFTISSDTKKRSFVFVTEPQEESEEEIKEPEERQQTPEVVPNDSGTFYDQIVSNYLKEHLEETVADPEPEQGTVSEIQEEKSEPVLEEYWLLRMLRRAPLQHLDSSDSAGRLAEIFLDICDQ